MNPAVQAFRNAAAQACSGDRNALRSFYAAGLEGILEEAQAGAWDALEIAAQVLARCCVEEGRFNTRHIVRLRSVMTYMNEQHGRLSQGEEQAWRDLVAILNQGGRIDDVRQWMSTHYG